MHSDMMSKTSLQGFLSFGGLMVAVYMSTFTCMKRHGCNNVIHLFAVSSKCVSFLFISANMNEYILYKYTINFLPMRIFVVHDFTYIITIEFVSKA